jgi:hypothetical protein
MKMKCPVCVGMKVAPAMCKCFGSGMLELKPAGVAGDKWCLRFGDHVYVVFLRELDGIGTRYMVRKTHVHSPAVRKLGGYITLDKAYARIKRAVLEGGR